MNIWLLGEDCELDSVPVQFFYFFFGVKEIFSGSGCSGRCGSLVHGPCFSSCSAV